MRPRVPASPVGLAAPRPDVGTAFAVAARLAVIVLAIWPAAVSAANSATVAPSSSASGPGHDRAAIGRSSKTSPSAVSAAAADARPRNQPTVEPVPDLIRATRDPIWKKRWDAVNALGILKDPRGMAALTERSLHDDNPHPRWRSLWAMSAVDRKATAAIPTLVEGLQSADPIVVHNAAIALAFFGRPEALDQLLRTLNDPDNFRRWEIVFSFRKLRNAAVVPALVPLLDAANEPSTRVRGETALVLSRIGDGDDTVAPALMRSLRTDVSHKVRWRAALALASVGDACLTAVLRDIMSSETVSRVREQIKKTIAAIGRSKRRRECPDGPALVPR